MTTTTLEKTTTSPRLNYAKAAPTVFQAMIALQGIVNQSGLAPGLRNLVTLRASQINGCSFCIDLHHRDAKQAGETDERLYLLPAWREVDVYTARERAALQWTETLTRLADGQVGDDGFAAARAEFSEGELAALTLAIVTINGWNRFNVAFKTPPGFGG